MNRATTDSPRTSTQERGTPSCSGVVADSEAPPASQRPSSSLLSGSLLSGCRPSGPRISGPTITIALCTPSPPSLVSFYSPALWRVPTFLFPDWSGSWQSAVESSSSGTTGRAFSTLLCAVVTWSFQWSNRAIVRSRDVDILQLHEEKKSSCSLPEVLGALGAAQSD